MRTTIKVADLSLAQWAWLNLNLPESREFSPDDVRMCVTLELTAEQSPIHVEMPPREFVVMVERLRQVGQPLPNPISAREVQDLENRPGPRACGHHNPPHLYNCRATL